MPLLVVGVIFVGCSSDSGTSHESPSQNDPAKPFPKTFKIPRPNSNEKLAWNVIEVMLSYADFCKDEEAYKRSIELATPGQLAIYTCTWYLIEVNNGGHHQFFFNSTGLVWEDALKGFRLLNAPDHERILSEAVSLFPDSRPSKNCEQRCDQMDLFDNSRFDALDERLYALKEDFEALALDYISKHPDEFFIE